MNDRKLSLLTIVVAVNIAGVLLAANLTVHEVPRTYRDYTTTHRRGWPYPYQYAHRTQQTKADLLPSEIELSEKLGVGFFQDGLFHYHEYVPGQAVGNALVCLFILVMATLLVESWVRREGGVRKTPEVWRPVTFAALVLFAVTAAIIYITLPVIPVHTSMPSRGK